MTTAINVGHQGPVGARTTPSTPAATKLRADHASARRTAIGLAIKMVEGDNVTDAAILNARQAADLTAAEFAAILDTLSERKAASDAYHDRNFGARIEEQKEAKSEAYQEHQELDKQLAQMRELTRAAHERYERAISLASTYARQQGEAKNAMAQTLGKTGDRNDWRLIR